MDGASETGHVGVLEWWKTSNSMIRIGVIGRASKNRHINVLNWWARSGLELRWRSLAMGPASGAMGRASGPEVLDWWKHSGLELLWSKLIIDMANANRRLDVLEWWDSSGLEITWSDSAVLKAKARGSKEGVDWLSIEYPRSSMVRTVSSPIIALYNQITIPL
ncbi:putative ankyrin repeat protein [Cladochytrium replicatum]|nr:putative ankyrin repeat protein [Cladochytrium replicatum]